MAEPIISVRDLVKIYRISQHGRGISGALKSLLNRKFVIVKAVDRISFDIQQGETVGYIGRNGAGKSTTIKTLIGILVPTSGHVIVDGLVPYRHRTKSVQKIGVVMGQRTQLKWDIPVIETFRLLKEVYQIPLNIYDENLRFFSDVLEIEELLSRPTRNLSLGERMKCDLAASFLHRPKILFLDEPTIGLDIITKERIQGFITQINREFRTTVLLTTHDLDDIKNICRRMIVIDKGRITYDGNIDSLLSYFGNIVIIRALVSDSLQGREYELDLPSGAKLECYCNNQILLHVDRDVINPTKIIQQLFSRYNVYDIQVNEIGIDYVVKHLYMEEKR